MATMTELGDMSAQVVNENTLRHRIPGRQETSAGQRDTTETMSEPNEWQTVEPPTRENTATTPNAHDHRARSSWHLYCCFAWLPIAIIMVVGGCYYLVTQIEQANWEKQGNYIEKQRLDRVREERARENELRLQHKEEMAKPKADMLAEATTSLSGQVASMPDPDAILAKLDNEQFRVQTGAWHFQTPVAKVEASVRSKLSESLPAKVVDSLVESVLDDSMVVLSERKFQADGHTSSGHYYQYTLRKTESEGEASIALKVSSTTFDMKKVVDHYETTEEPVYESVPERRLRKKGTCTQRDNGGRQCHFPFKYTSWIHHYTFTECTTFNSHALWCATSVDWNGNMHNWGYCSAHKHCEEDEYDTVTIKKFVRMAQTKFPIYSKRALPKGVDQKQLTQALDMITSREVQKVLAA